jgi:hypothetical protein
MVPKHDLDSWISMTQAILTLEAKNAQSGGALTYNLNAARLSFDFEGLLAFLKKIPPVATETKGSATVAALENFDAHFSDWRKATTIAQERLRTAIMKARTGNTHSSNTRLRATHPDIAVAVLACAGEEEKADPRDPHASHMISDIPISDIKNSAEPDRPALFVPSAA